MTGAIRAMLFVFTTLFAAAPALAHSPYFTQAERLALPGGQMGEIRLLHGDGIFLADPVRAMVVDAQGRPLARSAWSGAMTIACNRDNRCRVYDLTRLKRHEPDPASFRAEARLDLGNEDFGPVRGGEGYGFASRRMTMSDLVIGHAAYIVQNRYSAAIAIAASAFAIMLILVARRRTSPCRTAVRNALYYFCMAIAAVLIAPVLALGSLAVLMFGGMPLLLWLLLSSAGAIATGFAFWWMTRSPEAAHSA